MSNINLYATIPRHQSHFEFFQDPWNNRGKHCFLEHKFLPGIRYNPLNLNDKSFDEMLLYNIMYNNSRISLPFLLQKNIPCQVHPQALVHYMVMEGQHGQESSLLERLKYKQQYILSAHTLLLSEKIF